MEYLIFFANKKINIKKCYINNDKWHVQTNKNIYIKIGLFWYNRNTGEMIENFPPFSNIKSQLDNAVRVAEWDKNKH